MTDVGSVEHAKGGPRRADFVRHRLQVVDAYLDLVLEGDPAPAPASIAERAGVSRASVFRYFETLDELRNAAMGRVVERFPEHFELPDSPALAPERRIARFVDSRLRFHETLHPLALLQRRQCAESDHAATLIDLSRRFLADQVRTYFRRELAPLGPARREDVVVTIATLTSVESWDQSIHSHHRTAAQIRRSWIAAIAAALAVVRPTEGESP